MRPETLTIWLIAVVGLTTVSIGVAAADTFSDDDGSPHEADIEAIAAQGITRGCNPPDNDHFCPSEPITRAQMAAFLNRALGLSAPESDRFIDDNGSIFESDIEALAASGITRGCNPPDKDRFCPDAYVTRGQMAAFLVRAMGYGEAGDEDHFIDDDDSVFEGDIDRLQAAGVTAGCNPPANDRFCPHTEVSREQMASFLARALGLSPKLCVGTLGAVTLEGDLAVPAGASCHLNGTTIVTGNLIVGLGSILTATDVSTDGSIRAQGQSSVTVRESFIGADVRVSDGGSVELDSNLIDAGVLVESNDGSVIITGNSVIEDIVVRSNTGGVVITGNGIDGSLICEDNDPPPSGGDNTVLFGSKEGQCSGL